jgi:prepilin peptidase CpaA
MAESEVSVTWLAFATLLAAMGVADLRTFKIPNALVGALTLLFVITALVAQPGATIWPHVLAGALTLAVGSLLYAFRLFGAGDAKMLAVAVLWSGAGAVVHLFLYSALAGLVLLLVLIPVRYFYMLRLRAGNLTEKALPRVFRPRSGVPYGAALAAGSIIASGRFDPGTRVDVKQQQPDRQTFCRRTHWRDRAVLRARRRNCPSHSED